MTTMELAALHLRQRAVRKASEAYYSYDYNLALHIVTTCTKLSMICLWIRKALALQK